MRKIRPTTRFRRDVKRESRGAQWKRTFPIFQQVILDLANDQSLAPRFMDHALTGNWVGFRECHVLPDLLLIYQLVSNDELRLARLGSHSTLSL